MSLLAPALLLGLLALAVPILAHLLGRQLPRRLEIATLRFFTPAEVVVSRRRRPRELALLAIRLALLAGAVLLLARPVATREGDLAMFAEPHDAVILVDGSASMHLRVDGRPLLAHAAERIVELLHALPADTAVGFSTSDPRGPRIAAGADRDAVEHALATWLDAGPRPGGFVLADAVGEALALLPPPDGERARVIYAFGDRTAAGLGGLEHRASEGATLIAIPVVSDPIAVEHLGLQNPSWETAADVGEGGVRIRAEVVRRGGPAGAREATVVLRVDDADVARTDVEVGPASSAPVEFTHVVGSTAEPVAVSLTLVEPADDPLDVDDRRSLWLQPGGAIDVTVVDGDPSELRAHDEIYFLTTALLAAGDDARFRLRTLDPEQLDAELRTRGAAALADTDVLVLANVRAPAGDVAEVLATQVERGMGLWITAGDRVAPAEYNERLAALLPLLMRERQKLAALAGADAEPITVAPAALDHPLWQGTAGDLGLRDARVHTAILLEPDAERGAATALSLTNGAPLLLTRTVGLGRVAVLTTSCDRDFGDLPLRPGFVALAQSTVAYLAGPHGGGSDGTVDVGTPVRLVLPQPGEVIDPSGSRFALAPGPDGATTFVPTDRPGHYRVRLTGEGEVQRRPSPFVVAVPASESETAEMEVPAAVAESGRTRVRSAIPLWRPLVPLLALLLLIETLLRLGRGFRGQRRDRAEPR